MNNLKKSVNWKIQVTISINFISSKDNDGERVMHSKTDKVEIMTNNKADEVIEELFQSLLLRYHTGLETAMKGNYFMFDNFHLLH